MCTVFLPWQVRSTRCRYAEEPWDVRNFRKSLDVTCPLGQSSSARVPARRAPTYEYCSHIRESLKILCVPNMSLCHSLPWFVVAQGFCQTLLLQRTSTSIVSLSYAFCIFLLCFPTCSNPVSPTDPHKPYIYKLQYNKCCKLTLDTLS